MNPRFSVSFISWIHEEFILRQSVLKKKRRKRSIWNAYVNIKNNHFIVINGTNGRKSERRSRLLHCAHLLLAVFEGFDPATANPGRSYSPNFSGHGRYGITPQILPFRHRSSHAEGETTQERTRRPFHRLTGEGNARGRKTSEEDIKKKKNNPPAGTDDEYLCRLKTECSRKKQAERGAQRHCRRTSGASRAACCCPLQTEAARKEPRTIQGWQPACLTHRPHRCVMGKNRINMMAHYMGCILKRSRCGHMSP